MKMRSGNSRVAIIANTSTLAKRNTEAADGSPKGSYAVAASPPRVTRSNSAKGAPSPKSGNDRVADPVEESKASPPVPAEGASPVRGKDADVEALLLAKDKEIVVLREKLANHAADKQGPKITVSTEAANVPPDSKDYWVDASANKEKKTTSKIVVKHKPKDKDKPKADSTTGLKWKGYCVEGCGCGVCVKKRKEPSKTQPHNVKRVSKKPSPL
jgi:hypothetical protein